MIKKVLSIIVVLGLYVSFGVSNDFAEQSPPPNGVYPNDIAEQSPPPNGPTTLLAEQSPPPNGTYGITAV